MTTTIKVTDSAGNATTATVSVNVSSASKKIIGMSAPPTEWDARFSEVGANGIHARRIFGSLQSDGKNKASLIEQAISDNMIPVVSYKVPNVASAITGAYDAWVTATANYLKSLNTEISVTIWHEPRGDMTPAQYVQLQERLMPKFKGGKLKVGPILNGFLLDTANGKTEFAQYTSPTLMNTWDFFGIDTYQSGSIHPGMRVPPLNVFLASQGKPSMPVLIGEYNGQTADAIAKAGEAFISTSNLWIACLWNTALDDVTPLEGDRLVAFKATKADARVLQ